MPVALKSSMSVAQIYKYEYTNIYKYANIQICTNTEIPETGNEK